MGELLFVPTGRIGPSEFMRGVLVLIAIALVFDLLPIVNPMFALIGFVQIFMLWCWIVLWIKRYHDSGQSGWMCLVPILAYIVASWILTAVIATVFISSSGLIEALENADETSSGEELFGTLMTGGMGTGMIIGSALATAALSYGIAFLFNKIIRSDPAPNQFGPPSSEALADTFS